MSEIIEQPNTRPAELIEPYKKALLIDNSPHMIVRWGYAFRDVDNLKTVLCTNTSDALAIIDKEQPEVLFLDHNLTDGGSEGLEIARVVNKKYPGLKIYSVTGNLDNLHPYYAEGIDIGYIYKNLGPEDIDKVKDILTATV